MCIFCKNYVLAVCVISVQALARPWPRSPWSTARRFTIAAWPCGLCLGVITGPSCAWALLLMFNLWHSAQLKTLQEEQDLQRKFGSKATEGYAQVEGGGLLDSSQSCYLVLSQAALIQEATEDLKKKRPSRRTQPRSPPARRR